MTIAESALSVLRECTTLTLATTGHDGVWAADVFFAFEGLDRYFFVSNPETRHGRNILAHPEVAVTVHPDVGSDWRAIRGLQLSGFAALVPEAELSTAQETYFARFPFAARLMQPSSEVGAKTTDTRFFVVRATHLYVIDNRLGFGNRQEIEI